MRFYLLDRVTEINLGKSIKGIKCWSLTDSIFNEHFRGMPVVPGVLLIESMAQLLGILIEKSYFEKFTNKDKHLYPLLSIVHKAKFRNLIIPGDCMEVTGKLEILDKSIARGSAVVSVKEEKMATSNLSFSLIGSSDFDNPALENERDEYLKVLMNNARMIKKVIKQ